MFNLFSGSLVIFKNKTITQINILFLLLYVILFLFLFGISKFSEKINDFVLIWFIILIV